MSNEDRDRLHKLLFAELVMMFSSTAMQQLGKLVNPSNGKAEVNLPAAQATIDVIEMLKARTRGNLDRQEEAMLATTLSMLQMNYVETAQSTPEPAVAAAPAEPAAPAATPGEATPADAPPPPPEKGEPRYRKTYA